MPIERSKEWWLARIDAEPDIPIGAGWRPEQIAAARARLEHDTDPVVVEAGRRARAAHAAALGMPARCETNLCGDVGECLLCGDEQGERSRCRR